MGRGPDRSGSIQCPMGDPRGPAPAVENGVQRLTRFVLQRGEPQSHVRTVSQHSSSQQWAVGRRQTARKSLGWLPLAPSPAHRSPTPLPLPRRRRTPCNGLQGGRGRRTHRPSSPSGGALSSLPALRLSEAEGMCCPRRPAAVSVGRNPPGPRRITV